MNTNDVVICTNQNGLITCEGFSMNIPKQDDNTIYKNLVAPNWAFFRPNEQQQSETNNMFAQDVVEEDLYEKLLALATLQNEQVKSNNTSHKHRKHKKHDKNVNNTSKKHTKHHDKTKK